MTVTLPEPTATTPAAPALDVDSALLAYVDMVGDPGLLAAVTGTGFPLLTDADRRTVWLAVAADQEHEVLSHAHQLSVDAVITVSLSITRLLPVIRTAPMGEAAAATAQVCHAAHAIFAASTLFRGVEWISGRAGSMFRAQAGVLVAERIRELAG